MALGSFDHIRIDTKLVKDSDPTTVYSVGDFALDSKSGRDTTALILVKLGPDGNRAFRLDSNGLKVYPKRVVLYDTPQNRASWSFA